MSGYAKGPGPRVRTVSDVGYCWLAWWYWSSASGSSQVIGSTPPDRASPRPLNIARFQLLDPRARDFHPNWAQAADTTVAIKRTESGQDPQNRVLTDLVGELAMRSDEFRTRWPGTTSGCTTPRRRQTLVTTIISPATCRSRVQFLAAEAAIFGAETGCLGVYPPWLAAPPGLQGRIRTGRHQRHCAARLALNVCRAPAAQRRRYVAPEQPHANQPSA
jgi:MmyB-like transcription regulator ligand binding domain